MESLKDFFKNLTDQPVETWDLFSEKLYDTEIRKDEFFLKNNESLNEIAFVKKGLFKKYFVNSEGKEFIRYFISENEVLADCESLITQQPSQVFIQALEHSQIYKIPYDHFEKLSRHSLYWAMIHRKVYELSLLKNTKREFKLMTLSANERYHGFVEENPLVVSRVKKVDLASYLNISSSFLSRMTKNI